MKKKLVLGVMIFVMLVSVFNFGTGQTYVAEAAEPFKISDAEIDRRIDELVTYFRISVSAIDGHSTVSGKHFTKNPDSETHVHAVVGEKRPTTCDSCSLKGVLNSDWCKSFLNGTVSNEQMPQQKMAIKPNKDKSMGEYTKYTYTCVAFAEFCLWYMGRQDNSSTVYVRTLTEKSIAFTVEGMKAAGVKKGDAISCRYINKKGEESWHSFIFLGYDGDSVRVLDCNYIYKGSEYDTSLIAIHSINPKDKNDAWIAISRLSNRADASTGSSGNSGSQEPSQNVKYNYYVYYLPSNPQTPSGRMWYTYSDSYAKTYNGKLISVSLDRDYGETADVPAALWADQVGGTSRTSLTFYRPGYKGNFSGLPRTSSGEAPQKVTKYCYYVYYLPTNPKTSSGRLWYTYSDSYYRAYGGVIVKVLLDRDYGETADVPAALWADQVGGTSRTSLTFYRPGYKGNFNGLPSTETY